MRVVLVIIGFISLLLGMIGIFLPVLPTVPFLLLSSWCFAKGSDKFYKWFISTKIYKKHLESFEKEKSMTLETKIKILSITTVMLLFVIYKYNILAMRLTIIALILVKYYYFIAVIKTKDSKKSESISEDVS
ncbi:YbaN family protein [Peptostreptococcus russellii]|uniref:YbaN family protein n=1 Tax=Peptostreptococcus russellii TaxID=215200 RepID=UPI0029432D6D|nr:YbaN family protein [Peptostreptococcus russellii]